MANHQNLRESSFEKICIQTRGNIFQIEKTDNTSKMTNETKGLSEEAL